MYSWVCVGWGEGGGGGEGMMKVLQCTHESLIASPRFRFHPLGNQVALLHMEGNHHGEEPKSLMGLCVTQVC